MRVGRLAEKNVRRQFQLELGRRFRQWKCKGKMGLRWCGRSLKS